MRYALMSIPLVFVACLSSGTSADLTDTRLAAEVELRIGSVDDPEYSLTYIGQLEVGPDGTIYTLHPQDKAIRVHSSNGELVRTIGREGAGPGEFDRPGSLGMIGDTLWVLDRGLYRISYFNLAGEVLRTQNIPIDMNASLEPFRSPHSRICRLHIPVARKGPEIRGCRNDYFRSLSPSGC